MTDIDVLLQETRKFTPTAEFSRAANVPSRDVYDRAARDPEAFWAQQARELEWSTPFTKVLETTPTSADDSASRSRRMSFIQR